VRADRVGRCGRTGWARRGHNGGVPAREGAVLGHDRLLTLGACCFGLFMVMLDNTVVNVALPSIRRELDAGLSGLALVVDAYILVFASLLLTAGSLGDRFGRRRVFRAGLVVFTVSSALCGLAPSLPALVAGRVLQAVGAAALLPSSLAILTAAFPDPRERVQAIGLWSGVSAMALAAGPVVGGLLTDGLGWRWVFYVNLPVGVTAFVVAGRVVAESRDPGVSRLDLPGLLLGSLGLGAVTLGLIESNQRGWGSPPIIGLLAAGVLLLAGFVAVEARRRRPMVSPRFFRDRAFATANLVVLLAGFALLGFVFFNTLYFQAVQGWSPLEAGLRSLPNTLAVVVCAPLGGRLASRYGYRVPVGAGLLLAAAALGALAGIEAGTPYAQLWWKLAMLGAGLGLSISPATAAGVAAMPGAQAGVASAVITTSRQVGGALGVAVLGAVAAARYGRVTPEADPAAFLQGVHAAYLVAATALAVGAVAAALFLRPTRARPEEAGPTLPAEAA
jgi:EmrB/QacA subfamily drug resistance transporter